MVDLNDVYQTADWKKEKHTPVIDLEKVANGVKIKLMIGKEIPHPNTVGHHICWIDCYFLPEGEKFAIQVGRVEFTAHGGQDDPSKFATKPSASFVLTTEKSGTVLATSYCNIHGLWRNSAEFKL